MVGLGVVGEDRGGDGAHAVEQVGAALGRGADGGEHRDHDAGDHEVAGAPAEGLERGGAMEVAGEGAARGVHPRVQAGDPGGQRSPVAQRDTGDGGEEDEVELALEASGLDDHRGDEDGEGLLI